MNKVDFADGVRSMVSEKQMDEAAKKMRSTYALKPGAAFYRKEFGFYGIEEWRSQGLPKDADMNKLFCYDPPARHSLGQLGWCEAAFMPAFEEKLIEERGAECEVAQDKAGRSVLYFKGARSGFMPEYLDHPVKDMGSWEKNVKWRLDPAAPGRFDDIESRMAAARKVAAQGHMIVQNLIGGYMYLRSLIGPEDLLYAFYDAPELIHNCMQTWLELADAVIGEHQKYVTLDELFMAEDICYNNGPLISPNMIREFLLPYYTKLIENAKTRQIDKERHMFIQIDTDGDALPVIDIYMEIGMDAMSPFEVASGCDVVEIGRKYPKLIMSGGIDKRILAKSKDEIDKHLEYILPAMRARGGYIPTCDHGVPTEVSLENYMHYRKRCIELGG